MTGTCLGPWVNGRKTNMFTAVVVVVLVCLSVILTASVLFPHISSGQIVAIMAACGAAGLLAARYALVSLLRTGPDRPGPATPLAPPRHGPAPAPRDHHLY